MTDQELLDMLQPLGWAIDPDRLPLHDYYTGTLAGYATVDDYGTLVYYPWGKAFHHYSQSH